MQEYQVILRHDRGTVRIYYTAKDSDTAVDLVLKSELAPRSALRGVYATNVTPRGPWRLTTPGFGSNPKRSAYRARRIRLNAGGYDPGGAYWGLLPRGRFIYAVQDGAGGISYVEAATSREAIDSFF